MQRRMNAIAVLIFDGVPMFEISVPISVFGMDRTTSGAPKFILSTFAASGDPVTTTGGVRIRAPYGLGDLHDVGIVIVPSWRGAPEDIPPQAIRAIRAAHADGAVIVGLSTGAFVLAAAGLLDGRRAATHWTFAPALAARYPQIRVDPTVLYVDHGDVITSAGTAAGLDACLHIVARFWGVKAATAISRRMAVPPQRAGAQAQFVSDATQSGSHISEIMEHLVRNLHQHIEIDRLAAQFNLTRRTFDRQFRAATGLSPVQWILHQRVLRAQHLLEATDLTVDAVARQVGLSNAVSLRPLFRRVVGVSPQNYRANFRGDADR